MRTPAKRTNPLLWVLLLGGGVIAYFATGGPAPSTSSTHVGTTKSSKKNSMDTVYQPEDYSAHFQPVVANARDVFDPILKTRSGGASGQPNAIPPSITPGETWCFTGYAAIDGQAMALVEKTGTGEAAYLKSGEDWKQGHVEGIDPTMLTMLGPDGTTYSIPLGNSVQSAPPGVPGGQVSPENPLSGPIGNGFTIEQAPAATTQGAGRTQGNGTTTH